MAALRHDGSMLAGDADRERAVNVLKDAFTEGRLNQGEYEERVGRAYQARTYGELTPITRDLPAAGVTPPPLLGPLHWPCVGAVTPWALANVTFQYVTPSQPHAHPCSPDFRGDGLSTQLPGLVQSGASQYSLGRQSLCAVGHAQAFLMPFDPRPDGSGPPNTELHPPAMAKVRPRVAIRAVSPKGRRNTSGRRLTFAGLLYRRSI